MCFVLVRPFPDGNRQLRHDRSTERSCAIKTKMQYPHSTDPLQPALPTIKALGTALAVVCSHTAGLVSNFFNRF